MTNHHSNKVKLSPEDQKRLRELRAQQPARHPPTHAPTIGALIADWVAKTVGSWRFIIITSPDLGWFHTWSAHLNSSVAETASTTPSFGKYCHESHVGCSWICVKTQTSLQPYRDRSARPLRCIKIDAPRVN